MNVRWMGLAGALGFLFVLGCGGGGGAGPPSMLNRGVHDAGGAAAVDPALLGSVTRDLDAGASNPEIAYAVTFKMTGFTVPAGTEIWKCQDFANPFGGQQVDIRTWNLEMTPGSHHMTLFNVTGATDGPLVDCPNGVPKAMSYSFGGQISKSTYTYPDGVGEAIPAGMGFTMNSHYVNATAVPIQAEVTVTMFVAAPGVVIQHAGGFEGLLVSISVPPTGRPVTVGGSCTLPRDMNVIATAGHMHRRGSHFIATSGSTKLFETDQWTESAPMQISPPLLLHKGADLTWSCVYTNETGATLTLGESALTNVMCNAILVFYPIQDVNNPLGTCIN
jgi:hypothetical protein